MKVLYITHLTEKNGATIALRNVMHGMAKHGVEMGLVVPNNDGYICDVARQLGVNVFCNFPYPWAMLKNTVSLKMYLLAQWKTYRIIKEFKPDIVHCNTAIIDYPLLGCLLTHTPLVWHAREYVDKFFSIKIWPSFKALKRKMRLPFVHCIAITKGVFDYYSLDKNKDVVIYDGVISTDEGQQKLKHEVVQTKYFLFVGTFTEGKGAHTIFEQFSCIHLLHPEVELWLACSYDEGGDYYMRCMQIAQNKGFIENVRFLGFRDDINILMSQAIALIVPSMFEGFGFTTVEAMYNNCLVIGRNSTGTKEQFDNGLKETGKEIGLGFNDDLELPKLMERAINESFAEMKDNARKVVMKNYTTDNCVKQIIEFYKKCIQNK